MPSDITTTSTTFAIAAAATATALTAAVLLSNKSSVTAMSMSTASLAAKLPPGAKTGTITNRRSQKLHTLSLPRTDQTKPPIAAVVFIHGLADHSGRDGYLRLHKALNDKGVDVYAMDNHGHGLSEGKPRGYCNKYSDFVDDMEDYMKECQSSCGNDDKPPKWIIIAQSLGAPMGVLTSLRKTVQVDGLVLLSPACGAELTLMTKIQKAISPVLDTLVPKAKLVDAVRPEDLTRDPAEVQKFKDDPLIVHGNIPVRTGLQCLEFFKQLKERKGEVTTPLLLLHGTMDKTTYVGASVDFFEGVKSEKKCFVRLPGFYHEVLNEPERGVVLGWLVDFVVEDKFPEGGTNGKVVDVDLIKK